MKNTNNLLLLLLLTLLTITLSACVIDEDRGGAGQGSGSPESGTQGKAGKDGSSSPGSGKTENSKTEDSKPKDDKDTFLKSLIPIAFCDLINKIPDSCMEEDVADPRSKCEYPSFKEDEAGYRAFSAEILKVCTIEQVSDFSSCMSTDIKTPRCAVTLENCLSKLPTACADKYRSYLFKK